MARAQLALLEQRSNCERELERQIKELMGERNNAVLECHQLRILIMGSCIVCRKRFKEDKEYAMDHSIRNTIVSRRRVASSSAFEWFTGNLSTEMQSPKARVREETLFGQPSNATSTGRYSTENDGKLAPNPQGLDVESVSLATTIPDAISVLSGNLPAFNEAPLHWLSDKLFPNYREDANK